jgi:hypothetical protein
MLTSIKHFRYILILTVAVVYAVNVNGQPPQPDCLIPFDTGAGAAAATYNFPVGNGFDNRTAGCVTWTLEWQSSLSPTVTFQSSVGVATPTSYGTYTGTTVFSGTGIATFSNLQTGTVVDTPWVRVNVVMGSSGQTKGVLYGYKTGQTGGTGGGGGGSGSGCPNPCPVPQSTVPWQEALYGLSTLVTGQQNVTGSAAALSTQASRQVCVVADIGNTTTLYVGPSGVTSSTGLPLVAGQSTCFQLANVNLVNVVGTVGAKIEWSATD